MGESMVQITIDGLNLMEILKIMIIVYHIVEIEDVNDHHDENDHHVMETEIKDNDVQYNLNNKYNLNNLNSQCNLNNPPYYKVDVQYKMNRKMSTRSRKKKMRKIQGNQTCRQ